MTVVENQSRRNLPWHGIKNKARTLYSGLQWRCSYPHWCCRFPILLVRKADCLTECLSILYSKTFAVWQGNSLISRNYCPSCFMIFFFQLISLPASDANIMPFKLKWIEFKSKPLTGHIFYSVIIILICSAPSTLKSHHQNTETKLPTPPWDLSPFCKKLSPVHWLYLTSFPLLL